MATYRILSYILLVIGAVLGLATLLSLLAALANPALLLNVFIAAAVVMYSFSSFLFLVNGIDGQRQQKKSLKDFIRVNAFVTLFFCLMSIFQSVTVIANPAVLHDAVSKLSLMPNAKMLPAGFMLKIIKGVLWFMLVYSFVLLTHIQLSFHFLKKYNYLFNNNGKTPQ